MKTSYIKKIKTMVMAILLPFIFIIQMPAANTSVPEVRQFMLPSLHLETIRQGERDLPVVGQADVVVAGGGIAGVTAALSAAREGRSVILIETRNYFGQEYTATFKCHTIAGLPAESSSLSRGMIKELTESGGLVDEQIDPQALRSYLLRKINEEPLVKVYLFSMAHGVLYKDNQVHGVLFSGRDGRQVVLAKAVVDATEDARLAISAGAELTRTMSGDKTARRFMSVRLPESVPHGPLKVAENLGLKGNKIEVHDGFIELAVTARIGEDVAGGLSEAHALTFEKSFALRDHLAKEGLLTLVTMADARRFTPSPETWIDEMPAVHCNSKFSNAELTALDFSNPEALQPVGIDGLFIAGRTVDQRPQMGSFQALLSTGELAGQAASAFSGEVTGFPDVIKADYKKLQDDRGLRISELLDGIEPGREYPRIRQSAVELPVRGAYDVIVVGGGTSGAISAIAAARQGASVAVVEILPNLGGISSNRVNSYYWGAPWKSLLRLELGDHIFLTESVSNVGPLEKVSFSGEDKKHATQELAIRAGVHIYYQSLGAGAVVEDNRLKGVVVENASGRHVLMADVVIDATGHAGIAVAAGAGYDKGRESDGFLHEIEHGPLRDPTHMGDITESYLKYPSDAISLNIRESRRILGDYMVTFEDIIHERIFSDIICRWRCNYDTHFPSSANQSDLAQDWTAILGLWRRPIIGSIPYRSLLPKGLENILVVGIAYSVDHDALIAARVQPEMEHIGEAAGVAAFMASRMRVPPRDIPVPQLQIELVKLGVLRDEDVTGMTIEGGPSKEVLHRQDLWRTEREKVFPPDAPELSLEERILQLGTEDAVEAMVQLYLGGSKSVPLLQPLLGSSNRQIHEETAVILGMLGDKSSIPALLEFLKERNTTRFEYTLPLASSRPSVPLYWIAVILLGRLGENEAVPLMRDILNSPPPPEEFSLLTREAYGVDMFQSTDLCPPPLASFIIVALGRIGDKDALEDIRPFVTVSTQVDVARENRDFEISWGIQTNAAWSLAQLGDLSGVPELIRLLDSEQALLRAYARTLLERITGEQFGMDAQTWGEWWQSTL